MNFLSKINILVLALGISTFSILNINAGCEVPGPDNTDQEVITTVTVSLQANDTKIDITWEDLDGTGPDQPKVSPATTTLSANTTYTGSILLQNKKANGETENVTEEIKTEQNSHLFFYDFLTSDGQSAATGVEITKTDKDDNNLPVGLEFTLTTQASSNAEKFRVRLVHYGNKVKTNDASPPSGSDFDVDITFNIAVN